MKQTLSLISPRGTLSTQEYNDAQPDTRDVAMAALVAMRNRWLANAPHMIDGAFSIVDSATPAIERVTRADETVEVSADHVCAKYRLDHVHMRVAVRRYANGPMPVECWAYYPSLGCGKSCASVTDAVHSLLRDHAYTAIRIRVLPAS